MRGWNCAQQQTLATSKGMVESAFTGEKCFLLHRALLGEWCREIKMKIMKWMLFVQKLLEDSKFVEESNNFASLLATICRIAKR